MHSCDKQSLSIFEIPIYQLWAFQFKVVKNPHVNVGHSRDMGLEDSLE